MRFMIKDYVYTITEVDQHDFVGKPGQLLFGQTDVIRQTIKILKNLPYERKRKSLIHELSHAFQDAYGFVNIQWSKELISNFNEVCLDDMRDIVDVYFNYKEDDYENNY